MGPRRILEKEGGSRREIWGGTGDSSYFKIQKRERDVMHRNRLKKKMIALSLAAAMVLPGGAGAAFSDTQGHWASGAIDKWSGEYGIIRGYEDGSFHPDASITRGAFAGILDRFMKFQKIAAESTFTDTKGTYWEDAILKLNAAGVYLGNEGKALTDASITRQQAITMIGRAFGIRASDQTPDYEDEAEIAAYARGYVAAMKQKGYLAEPDSARFRPTEPITRAEIVNVLNHMVGVLYQSSGVYCEDIDGTLMINAQDGASLENMRISGDLILAPGIVDSVTLKNVTIGGELRNFSDITPTVITVKDPVKPAEPEEPTEPEDYISYSGKKIPIAKGVPVNPHRDGEFSRDENNWMSYSGSRRTRLGVDVSAYQNRNNTVDQTIDWEAAAQSGIEFAFVRLGLRGYTTGTIMSDAFYRQNVAGALDAGLETGVYFFSQAITVDEAVEEADYVLERLQELEEQGYRIDGPVAYDWEMGNASYRVYGIEPEMATACAKAFCQRIEEAGYDALLYASKYVSYMKYDLEQLYSYGIWFPEYSSSYPTLYYAMDYWQYTSSAAVPGISGKVDMSIQFLK